MTIETATKVACAVAAEPVRKLPFWSAVWLMAHRWKGRLFLAVIDQGFASTANFLLTILCAIWLPLDSFGRYVIVWSISLLIETMQVSLILDTMPAIIARYGQRNRRRLDGAALWVVLVYGVASSVLLLVSLPAFQAWAPEFVLPIACLAAANLSQRLYVFLRRLCYIRDRQDAAAFASFLYSMTLLGGAYALVKLGVLSVHSMVLVWGLANAVAVVVIYAMGVARFGRIMTSHVAWLTRQLWQSGRWLVGAAAGYWLSNWGMLPLVAAMSSVETAGIIRALQNLFTPIVQFNAALNIAILPRVADKAVAVGRQYARSFAIYSTVLFTALVVAYAAVVLGEARTIIEIIYRKPEIATGVYLIWPLALAMVLESVRQGSTMALLSLNITRIFFISRAVAVLAFVIGVVTLGRMWGAEGVLWANAASHAVGTAIVIYAAMTLGLPRPLLGRPKPPANAVAN